MSTLVRIVDCPCSPCRRNGKVASQAGAAEHLGVSVKDFRAAVRSGHGPRQFNPTGRVNPRYAVSVLDAWAHDRDDTNGAA